MECDRCNARLDADAKAPPGKLLFCDACNAWKELVGPWHRYAGYALCAGLIAPFINPFFAPTGFAIVYGFKAVTYPSQIMTAEQREGLEGIPWPSIVGTLGILLGLAGIYIAGIGYVSSIGID